MSSTPTIQEIDRNIYVGHTREVPRPTADDARIYFDVADLTKHQQLWDVAHRWDTENDQLGAERNAKLGSDRAEAAERHQREARADLEARLRRDFLLNPAATEADWAAVKDQKIRDYLMTSDPIAEQRAELLRTGRYPAL